MRTGLQDVKTPKRRDVTVVASPGMSKINKFEIEVVQPLQSPDLNVDDLAFFQQPRRCVLGWKEEGEIRSRQSGSAGTTMITLGGNLKCLALPVYVVPGILERERRRQ